MLKMIPCPDCDGEGRVEYDLPRPHGFGRDVGYLDTVMDECENCYGHGELEEEDE
jgi:DnaJ-class molecular chaperone